MARFIGSNRKEGNWGEDYFVEKLIEYCDDSYIIYRNRQVFGAQFDVCLLCPNFGIIIFEVKGWRPETIKRVIAGDTIVGRLQVQIEQDLSSNYISGIHLIKKSVEQFIRSVVA